MYKQCAHSSTAEQRAFNSEVPGSNPGGHTKCFLSSAGQSAVLRKRRPLVRIQQEAPKFGSVTQWTEYPASTRYVAGSSPAGTTICRCSPMEEVFVLETNCCQFESDQRYQFCRHRLMVGYHTFNVAERVQSPLAIPFCFRSSVERTPDSDSGSRLFDSGRKPHAPLAHW